MQNINVTVQAFAPIAALLAPGTSQARILRLEITQTIPAFDDRNLGEAGGYERVIGSNI
jgi:hypothetical protein